MTGYTPMMVLPLAPNTTRHHVFLLYNRLLRLAQAQKKQWISVISLEVNPSMKHTNSRKNAPNRKVDAMKKEK